MKVSRSLPVRGVAVRERVDSCSRPARRGRRDRCASEAGSLRNPSDPRPRERGVHAALPSAPSRCAEMRDEPVTGTCPAVTRGASTSVGSPGAGACVSLGPVPWRLLCPRRRVGGVSRAASQGAEAIETENGVVKARPVTAAPLPPRPVSAKRVAHGAFAAAFPQGRGPPPGFRSSWGWCPHAKSAHSWGP